ncbi:uncharacterized protein LOC135398568 [Ornithodoros turicata]|uniref:uncharacterized protein LOC135398568 n=1 Tax=Ornithodoros turicata TaxID=34597 RepID=UPI0031396B42
MVQALPPFPSFDLRTTDDNNIGLECVKWVERFENFLIASNITVDARKKALLLHYVGEVYDIFRALHTLNLFTPLKVTTAPATQTALASQQTSISEYDTAKAKLDAYFAPRVNPTFAVYRFRQTHQQEGESLDAFYTHLLQLARHCSFANVDLEIKKQLILATTSPHLRKYAMLHSLDLPGILKQGGLFEDIDRDVSDIERDAENAALVHAVHKNMQHGNRKPTANKEATQQPNHSKQCSRSTECGNCGGATVSIVGENNLQNCRLTSRLEKTSVKVFPYKATSPLRLLRKVSVNMT